MVNQWHSYPQSRDAKDEDKILIAWQYFFQVANLDVLKALVEAGADLNVQSGNKEWSPIMKAAFDGYFEIVKYLKNHGVDLDLFDDEGIDLIDFKVSWPFFG